ncbi:MAG: hydrogenase [Planctomycetes bacterium]|nr:hydrogenase [Planctomycetota bacterium]
MPSSTVALSARGQRLLWHGVLLFSLGLLTGFAIPLTANPRMALSSHLEGVLNGILLMVLGLAWHHLRLSPRAGTWTAGLLCYGTYANWAATLVAAALGTGRSTPLASGERRGEPWQEALVDFGLFSLSFAMLAAMALVLRGLRRPREYPRLGDRPQESDLVRGLRP